MTFLAGYYPRILHVINTLKNFRSRREKSASALAFFFAVGYWKPVEKQGLELVPVIWLEWPLMPLVPKRGGGAWKWRSPSLSCRVETWNAFTLSSISQCSCTVWKWHGEIRSLFKNTSCSFKKSAMAQEHCDSLLFLIKIPLIFLPNWDIYILSGGLGSTWGGPWHGRWGRGLGPPQPETSDSWLLVFPVLRTLALSSCI